MGGEGVTELTCNGCGGPASFNRSAGEWDWPFRCFWCEPWGTQERDQGDEPPESVRVRALHELGWTRSREG